MKTCFWQKIGRSLGKRDNMDEHGSSDKGSLPDRRARDSSIWAFLNIMLWGVGWSGWGGEGGYVLPNEHFNLLNCTSYNTITDIAIPLGAAFATRKCLWWKINCQFPKPIFSTQSNAVDSWLLIFWPECNNGKTSIYLICILYSIVNVITFVCLLLLKLTMMTFGFVSAGLVWGQSVNGFSYHQLSTPRPHTK